MPFNKSKLTHIEHPLQLPSQYKFIKVLGQGDFGEVIKCWKKDTKQMVALKIPKSNDEQTRNEVFMLKKFMRLKFNEKNIVQFIDCFNTKHGKAMVFEALDISLKDHARKTRSAPMRLSDIRTIIQQLATALSALKKVSVIHTDIKLDNIMMVNHQIRPYKVKLIDFGLAIPKSRAWQGMNVQPLRFRAPEILLGLPFSEAIDMWSLGIVMANMVCGRILFPGSSEYQMLQYIVELLGLPAHHLLYEGLKTRHFFTSNGSNKWRLKTPKEYYINPPPCNYKGYDFKSLDELKKLRLEKRNKAEAVQREQCIELLKAMLAIDAKKRITPEKVLMHPFITQKRPNNGASASTAAKRIKKKNETHLKKTIRATTAIIRKRESVTPTTSPAPPTLFRDFPVITLGGQQIGSDCDSLQVNRSMTSRDEDLASIGDEFECESLTTTPMDNDNISLQLDYQDPSAAIPSGVIMVRPASAENTLQLEDVESAPSVQSYTVKASESVSLPSAMEDFECKLPASPLEDDEVDTTSRPDYCSPSDTFLPSAAENTVQIEDLESSVSHQSGPNTTSESSAVKDSGSKAKASMSKDSTTCANIQEKLKKRKNRLQRVLSWMRKTFGSHRIGIDDNM